MPGSGEAEVTFDKFVEGGHEVVLVLCIAEALNVVCPVVDSSEPVLLFVTIASIADALGVLAEIDVPKLGDLLEDLMVQEAVVVRTGGLDSTTAPPAATFSFGAWCTLHWTRSPSCSSHSRHFHVEVNFAMVGLTDQIGVLGAIRALGARSSRPSSVVVLVASGPGCITTGLPHSLSQKSGDVRKALFAVTVTQIEFAVTNAVVLADSRAEAVPGVGRVELCEANSATEIRILQDSVNLSVTSAIIRCWLARSLRKFASKEAEFVL